MSESLHLVLHGKLSSESRFTTGVIDSGRAEEEISGGDDDGREASPDGVLGEARAEGSTPANRPMGELSCPVCYQQRLLASLEWTQISGTCCSVHGGETWPADASHQKGCEDRAL